MIQGKVALEHVPGTKNTYRVVRGFKYISEKQPLEIEVFPGWETDFSNIPRIFRNISSPIADGYVEAIILHDALYRAEAGQGSFSADIFLECMEAIGIPFVKRWIMYIAVRIHGWYAWRKHNPQKVKQARKYVEVKYVFSWKLNYS